MIYLDHNATTPVAPEVREAMLPYFTDEWGNPSSTYRFGARLRGVLETARGQVAELIGASPREVLFTSGATEANNAAILAALKADSARRHIVTSAVEHSSVLTLCRALEREGVAVTFLPVDHDGLLKLADLEAAITERTALVSLMWANNETGVLFPVERIAQICQARGALFHCDAVQAVAKVPVDVRQVAVDYLTLSGHKFHAPKGIGALYVRRQRPFTPLIYGGHQERGLRGGTENVALIAGLGVAAELARKRVAEYDATVRRLRDALEQGILESIPNTERNGHPTERLPNTTNITFHGVESEALLLLLDQVGICASSGSACLADSDEPSHVVKAMKPQTAASRQMVRFSLGWQTTRQEITETLAAVKSAVAALRG
ncbi:MAG TPA: IscS subfamily cysteine desulfurase [Verrucomicrobiota bacterium]|jgi:cysteine desulfurase|nr:IscS subfamily cysteine desulfurase [Verrucomicrobiota bacterium]